MKKENTGMKWETISSEYIFRDTWLYARKDRCIRPDGKIVDPYYVMEYPDWVTGLALTKDEKVILVRQYRHALGEVCLELPGGCVDKTDKNFEEAIRREFLEETGYSFETAEYLGRSSANPSTNSNTLHMFLLLGGEKVQSQQLDANEEIDILIVSFEEFKQMLSENKFIQSMHVTNIFYALARLKKLQLS
ncbi:NUDIX hydrolase [Segetibacter koreensis]|uniref:NUDIX hydrolase n=1 Tax=Segetibacter koreensis TaxID=398037 RepID=UPI00037D535D|nr:NUDIX hydrolase [Segetibacter koreensis]